MLQMFKFQFIELMISVTFLCPNKKVTKEVVIGEALMPRCRATNCTLPYGTPPARIKLLHDVLTT